MSEKLYFVIQGDFGISLFDLENDTMSSIDATKDKSKWLKFTKEEAEFVSEITGYSIRKVIYEMGLA